MNWIWLWLFSITLKCYKKLKFYDISLSQTLITVNPQSQQLIPRNFYASKEIRGSMDLTTQPRTDNESNGLFAKQSATSDNSELHLIYKPADEMIHAVNSSNSALEQSESRCL